MQYNEGGLSAVGKDRTWGGDNSTDSNERGEEPISRIKEG